MAEEQKLSISEISSTLFGEQTTDSDDSLSSDGLEIDISSPKSKKEIPFEDKTVLENIEEEIERQYDEKAAKSNLSAVNVKNILKNVLTNEHVWAMVRNTTGENIPDDEQAFYEPKLTRAKAKELLKNQNVSPTMPWVQTAPKSEVHILINEELPEDSDDDEYVPHEEESEDEKESYPPSDADSQPNTPATPSSTHDNSTQTLWTEDGVFKIPPPSSLPKTPNKDQIVETNENIALRTRSKLSLSDTPLEIIEEAFIPPDITTDMYDLECDDEDWRDFLKKFTRPLDEAVTGTQEDDDEADPEYNVLSDEEIDKLDKEELRQDRAVKITKKELNTLVAELFEVSEIFSNKKDLEADKENIETNQNTQENEQTENFPRQDQGFTEQEQSFTDVPNNSFSQNSTQNFSVTVENFPVQQSQNFSNSSQSSVCQGVLEYKSSTMTLEQLMLFEQQMRQHVQMLTQNYILSYKHPYFDNLSRKFKDMLLSLDELSKYKVKSAFRAHNLPSSVDFIKDWDAMVASDSKEVQEMLSFVGKTALEFKNCDERNSEYVVTFPELLMKKVTSSSAFIYPSLLPKIPFRYSSKKLVKHTYVKAEIELIALGLEQFREYLKDKPLYRRKNGLISNLDVCHYLCDYMMPNRDPKKLHWHIQRMRYLKEPNPINFYYANKKAPTAIHYVCSLEQFGVLPPCMRPPDTLPYQWKNFLYPPSTPAPIPSKPTLEEPSTSSSKPKRIIKPPAYKKQPKKKKLKISQPTIPLPILPDNLNATPYLVINNFVPVTQKSEVTKPSPVTVIQNGSKREAASRKRIALPQVEEIYIKTENYFDANRFCEVSIISEPPPISSTEQIKKFNPELLNVKFNSSIFKRIKEIDMLPSMPFLQTPVKEQRNSNDDEILIEPEEDPLRIPTPKGSKSFDESRAKEEIKISEDGESCVQAADLEKECKKDDEDELNALMVASSTMQQKNRRLQPTLTKKAKQMREYNATLSMLCPEDPKIKEEKDKNYAQAYYDKVQERLESDSPIEYQKFLETLSEHDETKSTVSDLYDKVSTILSPKYPDLCEEFLTFLTPAQAEQIGKLVPHFMMQNMSLFLRKLELYYNNQPAQLRRIYNSLTELAGTPDITMDKVKSTILPLLKGNTLLIDWFLQMFPKEPPPENMMTDWEQMNCDEDIEIDNDNKIFETMNLPEVEDPYGGPNCICKCHQIDEEMYKNRTRHCIPCGTKFLQGRVYVQTGKGLRLANVTFNSSDSNIIKRLSVNTTKRQKRKSETSPSKIITSPTKEDEPRHSNESEEDNNLENIQKKQKTIKSFSTSTPSRISKKPLQKNPKNSSKITKINLQQNTTKKITKQTKKKKLNEGEREEIESLEESSQDTLEESEDSCEDETEMSEDSLPEVDKSDSLWTREEDKVILETVQKNGESYQVYKNIQKFIPTRTETEIKHRFRKLINLVQIMRSDTNS